MNCKLWIVNCKQITVHYSARIMNSKLWTVIQLHSAVKQTEFPLPDVEGTTLRRSIDQWHVFGPFPYALKKYTHIVRRYLTPQNHCRGLVRANSVCVYTEFVPILAHTMFFFFGGGVWGGGGASDHTCCPKSLLFSRRLYEYFIICKWNCMSTFI